MPLPQRGCERYQTKFVKRSYKRKYIGYEKKEKGKGRPYI
jgi:hypothetical protein